MHITPGTRGNPTSARLAQTILQAAEESQVRGSDARRAEAHLYLTPSLTPMLRTVLPPPFNEVLELTHAKVYMWDDTVILTGANLSES